MRDRKQPQSVQLALPILGALLAAAGALAGCGDQYTPSAPGVASSAQGSTSLTAVPLCDAPRYATCRTRSRLDNVTTSANYDPAEVLWMTFTGDPLVESTDVVISTEGYPQSAFACRTTAGDLFLLVISADWDADKSWIEAFLDSDGDDLPEQSNRVLAHPVPGTHFFTASLHRDTATVYMADGLGGRVYCIEDSTGDGVPDASTLTVFVGPNGVLGPTVEPKALGAATAGSVDLWQVTANGLPAGVDPETPMQPHWTLTDTTGNGVADQVAPVTPTETHGSFIAQPFGGEDQVHVFMNFTGTFAIDSWTDSSSSTLLQFTGNGERQQLTLSRDLVGGESLRIRDVTSGSSLTTAVVASGTDAFFERWADKDGAAYEGGTMRFTGRSIAGTEVVTAISASSDDENDWETCVIDSFSDTELIVTIPEFGLTKTTMIHFRIVSAGGQAYVYNLLIRPDV